MNTNPHEHAEDEARNQSRYTYVHRGTVSTANEATDGNSHSVVVQQASIPVDSPLPVIPSVHGDLYIPPEGAPVNIIPHGENEYAVIGAPVPDVSIPAVKPGERVLSHPLSGSHVRFNDDGSLTVRGDGGASVVFNSDGSLDVDGNTAVTINGGSNGAITDVQVNTQKDSDGHVTDVSLDITRNSNILI